MVGRVNALTIWEGWKRVTFTIGLAQSRVLLSALYLLVVAPFAVLVKAFVDPVRTRRARRSSYYVAREPHARGGDDARRQY